ncbi:MAG: type II toxin-antitoxin system VapC family toxin [Legionellales bacterium]|nr:type II toxin-antitoxin system VapC family toxin [Legionellales bacterium]
MKLLLDTHVLLWVAGEPEKLSTQAQDWINDRGNELFFSSASLWEIVIKRNLGRADFQVDPRVLRRGLLDHGYNELPLTSEHAVAIEHLPLLHKDPFDRILIAQAFAEGFILLTSDDYVAQYPGSIKKI